MTKIPWDVTQDYIRSGHNDPAKFDPDSFRTIDITWHQPGIKAIVGCPKGHFANGKCDVGTQVQSYLFDKIRFTLEQAKAWFNSHKSNYEAAAWTINPNLTHEDYITHMTTCMKSGKSMIECVAEWHKNNTVAKNATASQEEIDAQKARANKYNISPKDGGNVTKPSEYANLSDGEFADPVNYRYPIDSEHVQAAWSYIHVNANQSKGDYSSDEWARMKAKVEAAMKRFGHDVQATFEGNERSFLAGLIGFGVDAQGKRKATFYIMNTSKNRNRWAVTDKALEEALPTLKGKPIGMGLGYKTAKHYADGETLDSGKFVSTEKQGAYATGTAEISDSETWSMLQKGELSAVSVVIYSYQDICSKCGLDLSTLKDPFSTHKCLSADGSTAYIEVESFNFKRVDFVDVPAYPQAGLLELSSSKSGSTEYAHAIELLASVYESQEPPSLDGITKKGVNKNLPEQKDLEEKMANLEQANLKLNADYEAAKASATQAQTEIKELKAKLDGIEKATHDTLVVECFKARADAGIAGKEDEEKAILTKLNDEALTLLKGDALKVASITQKQASTPKVKYEANSEEPLDKAVRECRGQLGFPEQKTIKKET